MNKKIILTALGVCFCFCSAFAQSWGPGSVWFRHTESQKPKKWQKAIRSVSSLNDRFKKIPAWEKAEKRQYAFLYSPKVSQIKTDLWLVKERKLSQTLQSLFLVSKENYQTQALFPEDIEYLSGIDIETLKNVFENKQKVSYACWGQYIQKEDYKTQGRTVVIGIQLKQDHTFWLCIMPKIKSIFLSTSAGQLASELGLKKLSACWDETLSDHLKE